MSYGQDDRVCAYTSLAAMLNVEAPKRTSCCILVDKEEIGITVAYDDVEGWINAIHRIADHPEEAQKMGANARKLAEKRFNLEIFSREIAESLLEISKMSPKKRTFA